MQDSPYNGKNYYDEDLNASSGNWCDFDEIVVIGVSLFIYVFLVYNDCPFDISCYIYLPFLDFF